MCALVAKARAKEDERPAGIAVAAGSGTAGVQYSAGTRYMSCQIGLFCEGLINESLKLSNSLKLNRAVLELESTNAVLKSSHTRAQVSQQTQPPFHLHQCADVRICSAASKPFPLVIQAHIMTMLCMLLCLQVEMRQIAAQLSVAEDKLEAVQKWVEFCL